MCEWYVVFVHERQGEEGTREGSGFLRMKSLPSSMRFISNYKDPRTLTNQDFVQSGIAWQFCWWPFWDGWVIKWPFQWISHPDFYFQCSTGAVEVDWFLYQLMRAIRNLRRKLPSMRGLCLLPFTIYILSHWVTTFYLLRKRWENL